MNKLESIQEEVRKKGVDVEKLGVLVLSGNNQIFGEILNDREDVDAGKTWVRVKDPKQFLRIQQAMQQGIVTNFIIGDMDMVESGTAMFKPTGIYFLKDLGEESQGAMLSLYLNFMDRKREAAAREAGLVIPDRSVGRIK